MLDLLKAGRFGDPAFFYLLYPFLLKAVLGKKYSAIYTEGIRVALGDQGPP